MTERQDDDDQILVGRAQQGDRNAFDQLMLRHQETIAQQMRRFSTDVSILEELTQTVFIKAYIGLEKYKPVAPFLHWLRAIASRAGYDHWRMEYKNDKSVPFDEGKHGAVVDPTAGGKAFTNKGANSTLSRILQQLSHEDRIMLDMLYIDNMSIADVAESMDWGISMTKMRHFRAKRKLRKIFKAEGIGPEWLEEKE